ncbi:uncharacterized protein LOC110868622 [Helianthus annuus]|uniref:uncharacterized protein LOC110868622 n=1 Tax=Helianthus annuus TaxID=4232 RepID=UPI001652BFD0|nr:uncharacterized protein LOC110868622 [Helianthus annuus]
MLNFQLDLLLVCCLRLFLVIHNFGKNPDQGERVSGDGGVAAVDDAKPASARSNTVWWQIGFEDINLKLKTVDGNSSLRYCTGELSRSPSDSDRRKEYTGVENRHLRLMRSPIQRLKAIRQSFAG